MGSGYRILAVDYANLLYRSYWSAAKNGVVPGLAVFRFIQSLHISMRQTRCNTVFLAGESFTILNRTKFDSNYKSGRRQPCNKDFVEFNLCLKMMLNTCGFNIVNYPGYEGDDVIATLCRLDKVDEIFIMSIDKDLRQLLEGERVKIVMSDAGRSIYTAKMFREEHGFDPDKYFIYKALVGDKSDSVFGVEDIGPVRAKEIMLGEDLMRRIQELPWDKQRQFQHSLRLIRLADDVPEKAFGPYLACNHCTTKQLRVAKKIFNKCYGTQLEEGVMNEIKKLLGVDDMRDKIIAIDFDGTLVKNAWPEIGEKREEIFNAALNEQKKGARLILWTCRMGEKLEEAIEFCKKNGMIFDMVNANMPSAVSMFGGNDVRKIYADEYWDDRNRILVFD